MDKTSEKTLEQLEEEKIDRQFKISLGIIIIAFIVIVTIISIWGYKNYKENNKIRHLRCLILLSDKLRLCK